METLKYITGVACGLCAGTATADLFVNKDYPKASAFFACAILLKLIHALFY